MQAIVALEQTLNKKTGEGECMPILFASRYLIAQKKKFQRSSFNFSQ